MCAERLATAEPGKSAYWTTDVATGIGFATVAAVEKKIVPRVSDAKKRVPVPPAVTGSAFEKNELMGCPADALQVDAGLLIAVTPDEPSAASETV
jgi:hypothetical protein